MNLNIGDKVTSIYEPNKVGWIISATVSESCKNIYTIKYEDGNEYANYAEAFRKVEN